MRAHQLTHSFILRPVIVRSLFLLCTALFAAVNGLLADGIEMTPDGRFVHGITTSLELTEPQIIRLEVQRENKDRLYRVPLRLNSKQISRLQELTGKTIETVFVFEGQWADCSCPTCATNIASRYNKFLIEVTSDHLFEARELQTFLPLSRGPDGVDRQSRPRLPKGRMNR